MQVREAIAGGYVKFAHIISPLNLADGLTKPLSITEHHQKFHYYLFRHLLQHNNKEVEMILPKPQNNHMQQISKNTSKKHNKLIEQLRNQQENPKHDEATVSTAPTEATTQTPLTPTSLDNENNVIPPPIPRSSSTVKNSVANEENPQDDVIIHQAIESDNPIPENILSLSPNKDPPSDDPSKNHDDKATSRDTDEPFPDPDQLNHTTFDIINANIAFQEIIIDEFDKQTLLQENYIS